VAGSVAGSPTSAAGSRHTPRAPLVLKLGRPVSAGVIRRLGNNASFTDGADGEEGRPEEAGGAGAGYGVTDDGADQMRVFTTRVHIGLDTFVAATGMGDEEDDADEEDGEREGRRRYSVPTAIPGQALGTGPTLHWQSGIVARAPHEVENAYQEISRSLIPLVQPGAPAHSPAGEEDDDCEINSTAGELSAGGTPEGSHSRPSSSASAPASASPSTKSVTSLSEFSRVTDASAAHLSSPFHSPMGRGQGQGPRLRAGVHPAQDTMDHKERMFHKLAPPLNARQRFLVVAALLSDVARSIMLGVSVLVKHAGAGHVITYRDLEIVLGEPCVAIVGRAALAKLLTWLKANIRSDINFKVASQTYTDMGLQRLFAFWPQLVVEVVSTPEEEGEGEGDEASPGASVEGATMVPALSNVRLTWLDRHWTSRLFREPDEFAPSINQV
jgi:hypothetical protein